MKFVEKGDVWYTKVKSKKAKVKMTNRKLKFKTTKKAFTLIELLVVIAIIGLLASIVAVQVNKARAKARDVKRKADLKQLSNAIEMYYNDKDSYPASNLTVYTAIDNSDFCNAVKSFLSGSFPKDPSCSGSTGSCGGDTCDTNYKYKYISVNDTYSLGVILEGLTGGNLNYFYPSGTPEPIIPPGSCSDGGDSVNCVGVTPDICNQIAGCHLEGSPSGDWACIGYVNCSSLPYDLCKQVGGCQWQ